MKEKSKQSWQDTSVVKLPATTPNGQFQSLGPARPRRDGENQLVLVTL